MRNNIPDNLKMLDSAETECEFPVSYTHLDVYKRQPMGFQYSITAIGSVILQTAVNGLGSIAVASMTAASRISMRYLQ